jgi:hypothetical protein
MNGAAAGAGVLPEELAVALEAITRSTDDLVSAASGDDARAIVEAVERRGRAVGAAVGIVASWRGRLDLEQSVKLADAHHAIAEHAARAERALRETMERTREAASTLEQGATAMRGYLPQGVPETGFDVRR